jgi:GTP-binding protein
VDISDGNPRDPVQDFEIIAGELAAFSSELAAKPGIVVATKRDAATSAEKREALEKFAAERGLPFFAISAVTGEGIPELMAGMARTLATLPQEKPPAEEAGEVESTSAETSRTP